MVLAAKGNRVPVDAAVRTQATDEDADEDQNQVGSLLHDGLSGPVSASVDLARPCAAPAGLGSQV